MEEFNLSEYSTGKVYYRNGKECVFDIIREALIIKTPEEIVRQKFIKYLIDQIDVPENMIEVEVPMCHFEKGAKGRADIVVYAKNEDDFNIPIFIVECKAPEVPMDDRVWAQVINYDGVLCTGVVIVTNGIYTYCRVWDNDTEEYLLLDEIPQYKNIIDGVELKYAKVNNLPWKRPDFNKLLNQESIDKFWNIGWIGDGTDKKLYPLIMNLAGFLQDETIRIGPINMGGINIIEDGHRFTTFGNAAGGSWTGDYRYFILEDKNGDNQLISISIFGTKKCVNDPVFGNRSGHTTLVVAIDDFDKSHNSLQLNLDRYTTDRGSYKYTIWHDGTLTLGKSGASKRMDVVNYVMEREPKLVNGENKIILGTFDCKEEIVWEQRTTKEFIINIIKYALLRDEFRSRKKKK